MCWNSVEWNRIIRIAFAAAACVSAAAECPVRIESSKEVSGNKASVTVVTQVPTGKYLWILSRERSVKTWALQGEGPLVTRNGRAAAPLVFHVSHALYFELAAVVVDGRTNADYLMAAKHSPPTAPSTPDETCVSVTILVRP
jgi:hypothetical protein